MKARYEYQGELEVELTEKIRIGLESITPINREMFASDIFDLISLAMNNTHYSVEERWELINSRAGQYLNNYVPSDATFPAHVMKELAAIRN